MENIFDEMDFIDFKDFYMNRYYIKECFDTLSIRDKIEYKKMVYSKKDFIFEYKLDRIWEYLNEPIDSKYFISEEDFHKLL